MKRHYYDYTSRRHIEPESDTGPAREDAFDRSFAQPPADQPPVAVTLRSLCDYLDFFEAAIRHARNIKAGRLPN